MCTTQHIPSPLFNFGIHDPHKHSIQFLKRFFMFCIFSQSNAFCHHPPPLQLESFRKISGIMFQKSGDTSLVALPVVHRRPSQTIADKQKNLN